MVNRPSKGPEIISKDELIQGLKVLKFDDYKIYHIYFDADTYINGKKITSMSIFEASGGKIKLSAGNIGNYTTKCKINKKPITGNDLSEVLKNFLDTINVVSDLVVTKVIRK